MSKLILGIESSCDETAASVVQDGKEILSNVISSQIDIHTLYGGVVPEIASRKHTEAISHVVNSALKEANCTLSDLSAIAVTAGPGLVGALLVGVSFAKSLAYSANLPLVPVHHIEGHIAANYLAHPDLKPPFICLVASGGHSHIVYAKDYLEFEIMGRTRDDAAGEAYDKIARILHLGYPGGPKIDKLAKEGNGNSMQFPKVHFKENLDFSFSGVKTAVMNYVHNMEQKGEKINEADVAASFQEAVVGILVENTISAAKEKNITTICMAGGVASNSRLRKKMEQETKKRGISLYYPQPILCTDNGAMIAAAGYYEFISGKVSALDLNARPTIKLGEKL
ncbi:MAG: tRNA (adenosine(37)-N6)-threonylcarbamoyltransferase complex transferase subunit TsaD [Clostridia bacterium]|nr:tRNA (adenosine(37)-N6)-threonylcarbamoyltransferase complex transferase subunit TsaD [Clostridia bacterium]